MKIALLLFRPSPTSARLVAEFYALLGVAWILTSHHLGAPHSDAAARIDASGHTHSDLVNPLLFVAVSAFALYALLRAANRRIEAAHRAELAAASRYRALLDTSLDAIHVLDARGRLVEANRAFYRSLGHDPAAPPPDLSVSDWDVRWGVAELQAKITSLLDRSEVFETVHRRRDGLTFEAEVSATGIDLNGDRLLVCVARDLTGRRQLQRTQLRAERLESLGLLAGGVAHDLNNALSPIILGADLLRARHPSAANDPLLESISSSARRGAGILRQLLTFARGVEGERVPVPVRPLLAGLAHLAEENFPVDLRVELALAPELPSVCGDSAQLHQVLLSLVLNARDAMPSGGTLVIGARPRLLGDAEAARLPGTRPGPHLEIFVRDTGSGLTTQAREHLFEPFFTTKPRGQGTGLGLSTALGIVRSHGGTLEHVAPAAGGAEFRILLPTTPAGSATANSGEKKSPPIPPAPNAVVPSPFDALVCGGGRLILLVEDGGHAPGSPRAVLERHGFQVRSVNDADTALTLLASSPAPALLLTDLLLPKDDGAALARRVHTARPALPIILMTALPADDARSAAIHPLIADGTLSGLLLKPFSEAQLLGALVRALDTKRS